MIAQDVKEALWRAMAPGLVISKTAARFRFLGSTDLKLHIGAGPNKLPDFLNVDINPLHRPDLWLDIRRGLPFCDSSVSFIYASHTIEHFTLRDVLRVLAECHRVLMAEGILRLVVPDLRKAIQAYSEGKMEWFGVWPHKFRTLGGRFTNYIFCDAQHKCAFDFQFLAELLAETGFGDVHETSVGQSSAPERFPQAVLAHERTSLDDRSLFLEGHKGKSGQRGILGAQKDGGHGFGPGNS